MSKFDSTHQFGLDVAHQLAEASEDEWLLIFEHLRGDCKLSIAVHQMNALLANPAHRDVVLAAFRRLGLEYAG